MRIEALAVDEAGQLVFRGQMDVDALNLMVMAETRESLARSKGRSFVEYMISTFGAQLVEAAKSGQSQSEIDKVALTVAMAAWLMDSIYGGVAAESFMNSNLRFTMFSGGAIKYDRIQAS
jgi:hypothetical protein